MANVAGQHLVCSGMPRESGDSPLVAFIRTQHLLRTQAVSYIMKILEDEGNVKGISMRKSKQTELKKRAVAAVRDYGVHLTLFRNAMNEWAGLNATDMECLRFLFLKDTATPSELSRQTGLTSGATTAMLDRLEKAGLIERRPNPDDRRGTLISPAKSANQRAASWFESTRQAIDQLLAAYPDSELEIICDVFERFVRLWDQEREKIRVVQQ